MRCATALAVAAVLFAIPRAGLGASADLKSETLEASRKRHSGKTPFLKILRPRGSQTHYEALSFAGTSDVGVSLTVNGKEVAVREPNGAFAGLVELKPGENELVFLASNEHGKTSRIIGMKRIVATPPKPLVSSPLSIATDRAMSPRVEQVLADGDWLEVSFFGSPGHEASFLIAESSGWLPMREANTEGEPNGFY
ncbi:MAG: hypothetical protein IID54_07650, partial [Proteobacteria bacterium]|nr:hypothetical protein [Pseudomonadota bacterium]